MGIRQISVVAGLLLALTTGLIAQGGVIRRDAGPVNERQVEKSAVNFSAPVRTGGAKVVGTVIDIRQVPVPGAVIQLRNLDTGNVEQTVESTDDGSYEFEVEDPGTFVVEMVMVDGYVVALSNAGSLAQFETLNTVVQLPGRWDSVARNVIVTQNVSNFFGMSAETSMTAATISLAVDANVPPANPGVPVSPK